MPSFAVIGLGSFGSYVARFLSERGFQVLAIDKGEEELDRVRPFVERAVVADATNREVLRSLGLDQMDAVVVNVGDEIDASILITLYLKDLGTKRIIVKAITEDHQRILDLIGATDVILPEREVAFKVAQSLDNPNILDFLTLAPGYSIVELAPPSSFLHKTLRQLDLTNKYGVQVIMVKELIPENIKVVPGADHVVKDSDVLVVLGKNSALEKLRRLK
ncbi:MAG: TrkA family potassium uptake protein [Calditrichaeota bacterium]|nr:TrkA family potassium uptake protein [Calditrichota bacterium]